MIALLLHKQLAMRRHAKAVATALEQLARRLEPALRKRFLEAIAKAKNAVELERLAQAVQAGNVTQAEFAMQLSRWPEKFGEVAIDLRAGFLAGIDQANDLFQGQSIQLRLDLINPYAVQYANRKLPKIVQRFVSDGRETIRTIVTEAVSGKHTAREAAGLIKDSIGLHAQYERAVARLRDQLLAYGASGERLEAKVGAYTEKLLKARAKTIARTEIIQAQVAGQHVLWSEAAKEGLFDKQTAKRVWRTNEDERTCPLCKELDGQVIPFTGLFDSPTLGHVDVFGEPLESPPIHPNCRCTVDLQF